VNNPQITQITQISSWVLIGRISKRNHYAPPAAGFLIRNARP
jgi:hypothetical protein